jgi:hypothetical protein
MSTKQITNYQTVENTFAEIDGKQQPVKSGYYGDWFVKYRYRYRLLQKNDLGDYFIEGDDFYVGVPITIKPDKP